MGNDHVAEPFRSILAAATAGTPNTPAELYANIRDRALEEAAQCASALGIEDELDLDWVAKAIRALKRRGQLHREIEAMKEATQKQMNVLLDRAQKELDRK